MAKGDLLNDIPPPRGKANPQRPLLDIDKRSRQGAWLLIASLGIFFFSSMLLYVVYVALRLSESAEAIALELPRSFLISTLILLGISGALHMAVKAAKQDETSWLIQMSGAAVVLAVLFFIIQGDGMYWLIKGMQKTADARNNAYGFTFVLAVIHALHVVGGLVSGVWIFVNSIRHQYDHERWWPVQYCALYWHFLDVVWIVMLISFGIASYLIAH